MAEVDKETALVVIVDSEEQTQETKNSNYKLNWLKSNLILLTLITLGLLALSLCFICIISYNGSHSPYESSARYTSPYYPNAQYSAEHEAKLRNQSELITIMASRNIHPYSDYHVLVSSAFSRTSSKINLELKMYTNIPYKTNQKPERIDSKSLRVMPGDTQSVKFSIGNMTESSICVLNVSAIAEDGSYNFTRNEWIYYHHQFTDCSIFIQTDKTHYKPSQLVQFRAIFLKSDELKPWILAKSINVSIFDPKENLVKQWKELSNWRGLLSLSLQLSDEPMLGDWTIKVAAFEHYKIKKFRVAEYVLSTFDVKLYLPPFWVLNGTDLVATVRATYTYGKSVKGQVILDVKPLTDHYHHRNSYFVPSSQFKARLINGVADISYSLKGRSNYDMITAIECTAHVVEDLTGRKFNDSAKIKIFKHPIKVEMLKEHDRYKPGFTHEIQLKVAYQDDKPVEDNGTEMELRFFHSTNVNFASAKVKPSKGLIRYQLQVPKQLPFRHYYDTSIKIETIYGSYNCSFQLYGYSSVSNEYMRVSLVDQVDDSSKQDNQLLIRVKATEPLQKVTCQILAHNDIVFYSSKDAQGSRELELELSVDLSMLHKASVLCFYISSDKKELIADSLVIKDSPLTIRNPARITTSLDEAKPGQDVKIQVQTSADSLVGLLGIDQSVLLLKKNNDITQRDIEEAFGRDSEYYPQQYSLNTKDLFEQLNMVVLTNNLLYEHSFSDSEEHKRDTVSPQIQIASTALSRHKVVAINLDEMQVARFPIEKTSEPQVVRSFFPETWIWTNITAGANGLAQIEASIPDTISSWVLSAFSLSETNGFGLTPTKSSIRGFRPFFIKINLPYSIIQGETVSIQAIVYNYSKRPISAKVTLENRDSHFKFVRAANNVKEEENGLEVSDSRTVEVPAEDGVSVSFLIKPVKVGYIDIRMSAQGELTGDVLIEKLLVNPGGKKHHRNKAMLIAHKDETRFRRNISIEVPADAVPDSCKIFVSAVGDILGAGLSNMENLLRLPYGCGEQNLINLVPNIVVLNYLQNSKLITEEYRIKAMRNIETGYQRQLNYQRKDGSFSAFGDSDEKGSVWLTAYVLKSFQLAKKVGLTVDERVLNESTYFITSHSLQDGRIEEKGMLHHKELQSNGAQSSSAYLTAYTMIALLQKPESYLNSTEGSDIVLNRGLDYLEKRLNETLSNYEVAIITYTLHLSNRQAPMDQSYEQLWAQAKQDNYYIWWSNSADNSTILGKDQADSLSIEMTAFALLSTVKRGEVERAVPIVRWLVGQQNSRGGFVSTQDTVLAIEALAAFATFTAKGGQELSIEVKHSGHKQKESFNLLAWFTSEPEELDRLVVNEQNLLVNQQIKLPDNAAWVQVEASGRGFAVVQVSWEYNLLATASEPAFHLAPKLANNNSTVNSHNHLELTVCTHYREGETSNMALMEVELPSGYVADVELLPKLKEIQGVKRVDTAQGGTRVLIYIDQVSREELCLAVPAQRQTKVSNSKPLPVTIYDYYNRQHTATTFYEPPTVSSCDICEGPSCGNTCVKKPSMAIPY